uniref:Uncharacterized protein n=1 Tax=viral metagenome TaxID=1070528 RepID=A0A6C0JMJ3_9ZZZZ
MVWIYESPPFTKREIRAYKSIRRKLKDKVFTDKLIKIISLYVYLKRSKFTTTKDIIESAYYDKAKTLPIFDEATAKKILNALHQKGGDSQYPFTDLAVKGILRDYTPSEVSAPVASTYGLLTGTIDTLKNNIPFADLVVETVQLASELGVTAANDLGEVVGGPIGALVVAPFTAVATGISTALSAGEGDLGRAVAHMANWVPFVGIILSKAIIQGERMAKVLKDHPDIASLVPYMTEFHQTLPVSKGGKRLSTMKHTYTKWRTQRKKFATH